VLFVLVVSVATEYGENGRFRFLVDPFVLGIATALAVDTVARLLEGRRAPDADAPGPDAAPAEST
jgi:hypothetical protein